MDPSEAPGLQSKPKSKNQKRNEKKKKSAAGGADDDEDDEEKAEEKPVAKAAAVSENSSKASEGTSTDPKDAISKKVQIQWDESSCVMLFFKTP